MVEPEHRLVAVGRRASAQHENVIGPEGQRRARHDGERAFEPPPAVQAGVVFVTVVQHVPRLAGSELPPAEEIEAVVEAVALGRSDREGARRPGPRGQLAPAAIEPVQVEHEEVGGRTGVVDRPDAAGHVDPVADAAAGRMGQRTRQRRIVLQDGRAVFERQEPHVGRAAPLVAAADAEDSVGQPHGDAVGPRFGQVVRKKPPAGGRVIDIRVGVIAFDAPFRGRTLREVGSAGHEQLPADEPGEDAGKTDIGAALLRGGGVTKATCPNGWHRYPSAGRPQVPARRRHPARRAAVRSRRKSFS